jgi:hypothetical protein
MVCQLARGRDDLDVVNAIVCEHPLGDFPATHTVLKMKVGVFFEFAPEPALDQHAQQTDGYDQYK